MVRNTPITEAFADSCTPAFLSRGINGKNGGRTTLSLVTHRYRIEETYEAIMRCACFNVVLRKRAPVLRELFSTGGKNSLLLGQTLCVACEYS